jgi:hypothetical protein
MFTRTATLLLMFGAVAVAAPRKDPANETLYLPITVGDRRVVETTSERKKEQVTEWVTAVETKSGMTIVSFSISEDGPVNYRHGASKDGVFCLSLGATTYDPPYRLLKLPAKEGETWEEPLSVRAKEKEKVKFTTGKEEEIEVPAGKFRAIRVESEYSNTLGETIQTTYWHTAGLGVVRTLTKFKSGDRLQVLNSFTPGKK